MEASEQLDNYLPLDLENRIFVFRGGARHIFRRVRAEDCVRYFAAVEAFTEFRQGQTENTINIDSARLELFAACILKVEGYKVSGGGDLVDLPSWKERIPQEHRIRSASFLTQSSAVPVADEFAVCAEGETVSLDSMWTARGEGNGRWSGLIHRFNTPDIDQRRRYLRARSRRFVDRGGRTLVPSIAPALVKLYDELIASVEGYSVGGIALAGRENIAREMDGIHKVAAARALFDAGSAAEPAEVSRVAESE